MSTAHFETMFDINRKRGEPIKYKCLEKNCSAVLVSSQLDDHATIIHNKSHIDVSYRSH